MLHARVSSTVIAVLVAAATTALPTPALSRDAAGTGYRPHFEPNLGQHHPDVVFSARASGYQLFLARTEAVFVTVEHDVVRMRFVDANPRPRFSGEGLQAGRSNYFLGDDPTRWATGVPRYSGVLVGDLWPGIGVRFVGTVLGNVFTHPRYRGRGYATQVTSAVSRELLLRGCTEVVLTVDPLNTPAVAAYTLGSPYVNHLDDRSGSISVGKEADLVVLDRDLFAQPPQEIGEARVLLTMVAGERVHASGDLA